MNHQNGSFLPSSNESKNSFAPSKTSAFSLVRKNSNSAAAPAPIGLLRPKCPFCSVWVRSLVKSPIYTYLICCRILSQPGSASGEPYCKLLFQHEGIRNVSPSNVPHSPNKLCVEHRDSPTSITQCRSEGVAPYVSFRAESIGLKAQVLFPHNVMLWTSYSPLDFDCFVRREEFRYYE